MRFIRKIDKARDLRKMELHLNDRVELKKQHPCGCKTFIITRVGMDIKWRCEGCGREIMLPRSKAEKSIKRVLEGAQN